MELQAKEFAAAIAQRCERGFQPVNGFVTRGLLERIFGSGSEREIVDRDLRVLAAAENFTASREDFEARDLERERNQLLDTIDFGIFFVKHE